MRWKWLVFLSLGLAACTGRTQAQVATPFSPPPTLDLTLVQQGKEVYQANCATCHGVNAEGA
ncbi:MAG TPA: c-type cytochrome, partial [Anaerolineales bacterium]|nr:c-type cytochrome [Anaerolineales bacterium]